MHCVIMIASSSPSPLVRGCGGKGEEEAITNDVFKFRKVTEFESWYILIGFFYIYLVINGKRSFIN